MKITIQRSLNSKVLVDQKVVGEITKGMVLFVCFEKDDVEEVIERAANKILKLRIFTEPETGKMNWDISQIQGSFLVISQFTLSWDGAKGNRPGFERSLEPQLAKIYFEKFCQKLKQICPVQTGVFGEHMDVHIHNDGPVTFSLSFL